MSSSLFPSPGLDFQYFPPTQLLSPKLSSHIKTFSTSDNMQTQKSNKYQGSKFAEGRLKLSTACTECHKRKQKVRPGKNNGLEESSKNCESATNSNHVKIAREDILHLNAYIVGKRE